MLETDIKPRPNQELYLEAWRNMSVEKRLLKIFELSSFARELFRAGLRKQYHHLSETDFQQLYLERLAACHNRNY